MENWKIKITLQDAPLHSPEWGLVILGAKLDELLSRLQPLLEICGHSIYSEQQGGLVVRCNALAGHAGGHSYEVVVPKGMTSDAGIPSSSPSGRTGSGPTGLQRK